MRSLLQNTESDPREQITEDMLMEMYHKNEIENKIISVSTLEELPEDFPLVTASQQQERHGR